jgi:hypothetical protein
VVEGDHHVDPRDPIITSVHFRIDDDSTLFYDFNAFSMVPDARPLIDQIVRANPNSQQVTTGPDPLVLYFTGSREIFAGETALGTVRADHNPTPMLRGSDGAELCNRMTVSVVFKQGIVFHEALRRTRCILDYLGLIVGRPQNLPGLQIQLRSENNRPILLDVYWAMPPKRDPAFEGEELHSMDVLLDAVRQPEMFAQILAGWLDRQEAWNDARFRFFNSFAKQRRYDIDRLVGSANMFDVLPSTAVPSRVELSSEIQRAKAETKRTFEALPASAERDSVLGVLGRLGTSSLKHKIRYRARPLVDATGKFFEDLPMVTDEAVNCRNHYVHGSEPRFDYNRNFDAVIFFTETLEFVFATSDLIEAGWDVTTWSRRGTTMTHPFSRYLVNYPSQLQMLKNLLPRRQI